MIEFPRAVYDQLHSVAKQLLRRERPDHTLQATAVVHEVFLKLAAGVDAVRSDARNFALLAPTVIRQILVDHARRRGRQKRIGGRRRIALDERQLSASLPHADIAALDDLLHSLAERHPRKAKIVEMRFFGGLDAEEIAVALGVTSRTVERDWAFARSWLASRWSTPCPDVTVGTDRVD